MHHGKEIDANEFEVVTDAEKFSSFLKTDDLFTVKLEEIGNKSDHQRHLLFKSVFKRTAVKRPNYFFETEYAIPVDEKRLSIFNKQRLMWTSEIKARRSKGVQ